MRNVSNPCNHSYKHYCFLPSGNNTSPSLMFLSLKLDIEGHEPTIKHNAPSWSYYILLGQSNKKKQRTCKNYSRTKYKRRTKYITHHNLNSIGSQQTQHSNRRMNYIDALIMYGSSQGLRIEAQDWRNAIT